MGKLESLIHGLIQWAIKICKRRVGLKKDLSIKLESLLEEDRNDENLTEIIDTKLHINLEIDKDEVY